MEFTSIIELNTYLSDNLTKLDIKQYIKKYHDVLHQDIDVSFMDYFLYLCDHPNEIIVKHEKLIEFGIFTSTRSNDIKNRIDSIELVEGVDYLLRNVLQQLPSGAKHTNHYTFTPKAFKLCLMRSKKQIKYAKYYLFLEECIHYYQKYQELYTNVLLSGKDTKIDNLNKKIDDQNKKIDELLGYANDTKVKLEETQEQNEEILQEVEELHDKVEDLRDTVKERNEHFNVDPTDDKLIHMFALLQYKNNLNVLRIIRGQNKHLSKNINQDDYNIIINKSYNPNPVDLYALVKDKIKENDKNTKQDILNRYKDNLIDLNEKRDLLEQLKYTPPIKIRYNTIILNKNTSIDDLIELIRECDKIRTTLNIP